MQDANYGNFGLITELSDIKATIAALQWIFSSAAKYDVEEDVLTRELQQLGLPKGMLAVNRPEHCDALARPYKENKQKLRERFETQTLQCKSRYC